MTNKPVDDFTKDEEHVGMLGLESYRRATKAVAPAVT